MHRLNHGMFTFKRNLVIFYGVLDGLNSRVVKREMWF
jgi:hypothetical protein